MTRTVYNSGIYKKPPHLYSYEGDHSGYHTPVDGEMEFFRTTLWSLLVSFGLSTTTQSVNFTKSLKHQLGNNLDD